MKLSKLSIIGGYAAKQIGDLGDQRRVNILKFCSQAIPLFLQHLVSRTPLRQVFLRRDSFISRLQARPPSEEE